jgi:hypothetical protein
MLAIINNAEELRPCAIIIIRAPYIPQRLLVSSAANINPMCPTDEYAIKDFRSGCRIQISLVAAAPVNATLINSGEVSLTMCGKIDIIRTIPYPPNLRRIAASTIEPAIGAST